LYQQIAFSLAALTVTSISAATNYINLLLTFIVAYGVALLVSFLASK